MKHSLSTIALALCIMATASAQTANYEQAARFSSKSLRNMVYSTKIRPNWFRDSDKFWYSWKTADGTRYYVVDAATGSKKELFDLEKLAREITGRCTWNSRTTNTSSGTSSPRRRNATAPETLRASS